MKKGGEVTLRSSLMKKGGEVTSSNLDIWDFDRSNVCSNRQTTNSRIRLVNLMLKMLERKCVRENLLDKINFLSKCKSQ